MRVGEKENPWKITPDDWHENGVPWGDYCECCKCGLVARSTTIFDYYASAPGLPMKCETCQMGTHRDQSTFADAVAAKIISEDN